MQIIRIKTLVLFFGTIAIVTAGCNEEAAPSVKKSRLIASENKNLLKQLDQRDNQIELLKQQHSEELAKQKELLSKCQQERDTLKEKVDVQIEVQVQGVLQTIMDENKLLREQVESLEAKLKERQ